MQLKFEANQDFQLQAIASVINLFDGQPRRDIGLEFAAGGGFAAVPNYLELSRTELLQNLQSVQLQNGLPADTALQTIDDTIETVSGSKRVTFFNFSVEMETGTGKTYVYIRTALELFRRYGMRKFIVVVPSVAVREGVLKTLAITQQHLRSLYDNVPYRYYAYNSADISQVRQFALSDSVEIMVMTIDSFNKATNVIRQSTDRLQGETPIHLVQASRPILILDEPQNMESELRIKALAMLDPLYALRYSATHRNPYNVVYRLTPYEAYRQGLVKRIEVAGAEKQDDANQVFLRVDDIRSERKTLTARLTVHRLLKTGAIKEVTVTVRPGDNLESKTNRSEYQPYTVDELDLLAGVVRFSNGVEIRRGEAQGADKEAIFEAQICYTIGEHFRKSQALQPLGIKVLSLFFIDRVDNYVRQDGVIRRLFKRCFNELKRQRPEWEHVDPEAVQAGYFAQRRTRDGTTVYEDSKTGESEKDREAYDLIMRDKERLLSVDEPVSFIFSHSALREGWDNPNVFQVCTLRQVGTETERRQQVGRGIRLAVNQEGERVRSPQVNVLTVVANENFERYVEQLQAEIAQEYGKEGLPPKPANARQRGVAQRSKKHFLSDDFRELWERIKQKTRYAVTIDSGKLVDDVVRELDRVQIRPPRVTITRALVDVQATDSFQALQMSSAKTIIDLAGRFPLPNLVDIMSELLERTTPPVRLTRRTLLDIFKRTLNQQAALDNPHEFAAVTVRIIKERLLDQLIEGIKYEKISLWYEMSQFDSEVPNWEEYLVPAEHSLYDHVIVESGVEREFVEGLERRLDVKLYVKLPGWFSVDTPLGTYNPDWAIVMKQDGDEAAEPAGRPSLYLVRETKSTTNLDELRPDEKRKILCGEQHFVSALGVSYRVVTSAAELP